MYHIIINPASRSGKGQKLWENIVKPYLTKEKIDYIPHFSDKPGEVAVLTEQLTLTATAEHPAHLIILGGDGTFNEAVQGIRDFSSVILGYIPTGSSNDLARDLLIPRNPALAVQQAFHSTNIHKMDVGCVTFKDGTSRRFTVSCGMGFDAAVCEEVNDSSFKATLNKFGLGKLAYLSIAIKQLLTAKSVSCEMTLDGKTSIKKKLLFVAAMIHRYEGGGFLFGPDALDHDGIFNICSVRNVLPKWLILLALPTAFWGKHYLFPGIDPLTAKSIHIKTSKPLWIHTDGEVLREDDSMTISCMNQVLQLKY
jgi:YegS/Rv2252/BmrU family lipid kinase